MVDAGGDITALKRHGGWKSSTVAEGYIDDSTTNRVNVASKIVDAVQGGSKDTEQSEILENINQHPSTSSTLTSNIREKIENNLAHTPLQFINCTNNNFTFNFHS